MLNMKGEYPKVSLEKVSAFIGPTISFHNQNKSENITEAVAVSSGDTTDENMEKIEDSIPYNFSGKNMNAPNVACFDAQEVASDESKIILEEYRVVMYCGILSTTLNEHLREAHGEHCTSMRGSRKPKKNIDTKKHYCKFCKSLQSKLSRHLERIHSAEPEVMKITNLEKVLLMGIFEVVLSIGMLLGTVSSSYIFNAINYVGVFTVAAGLHGIALLYTLLVLKESLHDRETEGKLKAFFEFEQIKIMTRTTFKQRPNNKRILILLCLTITSLFIFGVMSEGGCIYLFLRLKFGWSLKQYTLFTSVRDVLSILGTFIGVYGLHKILKVDETVVILMGLISCMNGSLIQGLASTGAHIYFGGVLRMLTGNVSPMLRSLISKICEPDEVGKVFSVLVMCENFLQMLGSPLYTYIYNETLDTYPEFFNFVTAGIHGVTVILTIIVAVIHNRNVPDEPKFSVLCEDPSAIADDSDDQLIS